MTDVRILDLKTTKIRACTIRREDGSFLTIINARMAGNVCREALRHEERHIDGGDFDKADADRLETIAHKGEKDAR